MFLRWYKQSICDYFLYAPVVYDMLLLCNVLFTFHRKRAVVFFPLRLFCEGRFVSHLRLPFTFRGVSRLSDVKRSV